MTLSKLLRPATLAPLLCLIYALAVVGQFDNPLALATLGARYAPPDLQSVTYSDEGYDGQTVYLIARDGFAAAPYIDVPAYRFQRILLPAAGAVLALGQDDLLHWALFAVNLLALGVSTYLLERLLMDFGVSRWYALGYALSAGVLGAARLLTTEPLAYGLVIAAIYSLHKHDNWWLAALLFALAALAKETTLLFVGAYGLWWLCQQRFVRAIAFGVLAGLPFALWQLVLLGQFGTFGVGSGGEGATGFEIIPFWGFIRILIDGNLMIFAALGSLVFLFALLPALAGFVYSWRDYRSRRFDIWTLLLLVNALLMLFVPFSTYRELLGILRFIVGLQIAVILYAASRRKKRLLLNSTLWMVTSLLVIFSDFALLQES
jgi:hypothetical protein